MAVFLSYNRKYLGVEKERKRERRVYYFIQSSKLWHQIHRVRKKKGTESLLFYTVVNYGTKFVISMDDDYINNIKFKFKCYVINPSTTNQ
mmetsp:Transcript_18984/g.20440  ORF Transcript_18984/g.20440 Transcript_18984/m.20440 type:complete len:90 (-) Transcript_18984:127-396(-)